MRILLDTDADSEERFAYKSHRLLRAIEGAGFDVCVVTATGNHDMETPFVKVREDEP